MINHLSVDGWFFKLDYKYIAPSRIIIRSSSILNISRYSHFTLYNIDYFHAYVIYGKYFFLIFIQSGNVDPFSFKVFLTRCFLKLFLGLLIHFILNLNFFFLCFSKIFEYAMDFLFSFRIMIAKRTPSIIIGMIKTADW